MKRVKENNKVNRYQLQIARYEKGQNPERIALLLSVRQKRMVARYAQYARIANRLQKIVSAITDEAMVPSISRVWYLNFAREVEKLWRHYPNKDLTEELKIRHYKWLIRGLDPFLLQRVAGAVLTDLRRQKESNENS